jgi:hypothetical protein
MDGETRDLSDKSKLVWFQFIGPMQAAANAFNAAIVSTQNLVAGTIIRDEGLDPDEWALDMGKVKLVRLPEPLPELPKG